MAASSQLCTFNLFGPSFYLSYSYRALHPLILYCPLYKMLLIKYSFMPRFQQYYIHENVSSQEHLTLGLI